MQTIKWLRCSVKIAIQIPQITVMFVITGVAMVWLWSCFNTNIVTRETEQNVKVSAGKKNMNRIRALRALTGRGGGKGEGGMWSNSFHPSPGQAPGHGPGWPGLDTAHIGLVTRCLGSPEQNRVITSHIAFPVSPDPALTSPGTLCVCGHIVIKITLLPTTGLKVCGYIFDWISE